MISTLYFLMFSHTCTIVPTFFTIRLVRFHACLGPWLTVQLPMKTKRLEFIQPAIMALSLGHLDNIWLDSLPIESTRLKKCIMTMAISYFYTAHTSLIGSRNQVCVDVILILFYCYSWYIHLVKEN